jgi:hypothetical protein
MFPIPKVTEIQSKIKIKKLKFIYKQNMHNL